MQFFLMTAPIQSVICIQRHHLSEMFRRRNLRAKENESLVCCAGQIICIFRVSFEGGRSFFVLRELGFSVGAAGEGGG